MRPVLFDIDGTLIDSGGAGKRALDNAMKTALSIEDAFSGVSMAGKTDIQIVKGALVRLGIPPADGIVPSVISSYLANLVEEMENPWKKIKPGIKELLDELSAMPGVAIGLLTGNVMEGARIKLEPFGLNGYFCFGAFGSDNEDRNKLLPEALRRLRELSGVTVPYESCVVVGDTPLDVLSAKTHGAHAVAVATGPYTVEELSSTGADMVIRDFTERGLFMGLLK
jgi:phosphoglycolate phosphatase-like HAD superfamily hydrolase